MVDDFWNGPSVHATKHAKHAREHQMTVKTLLLLALLPLAACQHPTRGFDTTSNDDVYTVHWNTATGSEMVVDEYFTIRATVDPKPRHVSINAGMPEHRHGMLHEPSTEQLSHTTWLAKDMLFHMPGLWRVQFDITDANGTVHRAESDVVLE